MVIQNTGSFYLIAPLSTTASSESPTNSSVFNQQKCWEWGKSCGRFVARPGNGVQHFQEHSIDPILIPWFQSACKGSCWTQYHLPRRGKEIGGHPVSLCYKCNLGESCLLSLKEHFQEYSDREKADYLLSLIIWWLPGVRYFSLCRRDAFALRGTKLFFWAKVTR